MMSKENPVNELIAGVIGLMGGIFIGALMADIALTGERELAAYQRGRDDKAAEIRELRDWQETPPTTESEAK